MRVALYARVSKDNGTQDTRNQLHDLREHAANKRWTIVAEYVDHASGKRGDREQLQAMLASAERKEFDVLLFWAVDRLTREGVLKTLTYLQQLDKAGVCWLSHTEPYFDSCGPFKDVVVSMMATLAKMEREKISERTKAGLRQAVRNGKTLGQPRKAVDVAEIRRLQAEGMKLTAIADVTGVNLRTIMRRLAE